MKGVTKSQAENIVLEEHYNCLSRKEYQTSFDNYLIRSITRDMYLQKVNKRALFDFDEKRKYITAIESFPWN